MCRQYIYVKGMCHMILRYAFMQVRWVIVQIRLKYCFPLLRLENLAGMKNVLNYVLAGAIRNNLTL
jgi:hypothetical protein